MKKPSPPVIGAVLGVVVLAVVAVFGILLPNVEPSSADGSRPELPARAGGLVALDSGQLPATLQQQIGGRAQVARVEKQGADGLRRIHGTPVTYRFYATTDAQALAAVTVVPGEPGLFSPDGPPVPSSGQQTGYQLRKVGGAVCAEYQAQQSGLGQPGQPARVHCQLGASGNTYDVDARGLSAARTVALAKDLAGS